MKAQNLNITSKWSTNLLKLFEISTNISNKSNSTAITQEPLKHHNPAQYNSRCQVTKSTFLSRFHSLCLECIGRKIIISFAILEWSEAIGKAKKKTHRRWFTLLRLKIRKVEYWSYFWVSFWVNLSVREEWSICETVEK